MKIVFTPNWFLGSDVLIEGFSFLVLLLFFIFSMRSYKLSKNKNTKALGIGFLLIAIAQLATILTKTVLYYDSFFTQKIGELIVTYKVVKSVDIFYYIGFFFQKVLTLLGFYTIYRTSLKKKSSTEFWLITYFLIISVIMSESFYYIYHLTAIALLILIIKNYSAIYKKNKLSGTKVFITALTIMTIAHVIFVFSVIGDLYITGQILELMSYLILLGLIIKILKYGGKKKKSHRYNI